MSEFFQIMFWPFLACLVLTGIHAYLGFHVIERGVIFADLALAQIAALGAGVGLVLGHHADSACGYWFSLGFTLIGAGLFALTRFRRQIIPQEALIGIVYVVASALLVIVLSLSGEGTEHIREMLVGNILLATPADVGKMFAVYSIIGVIHFLWRKRFNLISQNPHAAFQNKINVRFWDFVFYATFGIVVTSSVKIAGVLLVFSFLVIPAVCAMLFSGTPSKRLALGWMIGSLASLAGMVFSYYGDHPTGAAVVVVFGIVLVFCIIIKKIFFRHSSEGYR